MVGKVSNDALHAAERRYMWRKFHERSTWQRTKAIIGGSYIVYDCANIWIQALSGSHPPCAATLIYDKQLCSHVLYIRRWADVPP